jgi:hypothetical protein
MQKFFSKIIRTFGFLRLSLVTLVCIDMLMRPIPGATPDYESSHGIIDLLSSVLAPILFMLLLLDAVMTGVYMTSMPAERKSAYRLLLFTDLGLAVIFLLYWLPFFRAINA